MLPVRATAQKRTRAHTTFVHRQPEHIEIAGALGLGVWDRKKIDLREVKIQGLGTRG